CRAPKRRFGRPTLGHEHSAVARERAFVCHWRRRRGPSMRAAMSPSLPPSLLSHAELDTVIRLAPLIAIDLIIRNARDEVLLGLRKNEPAKGCYFVPGGMILKNERLADAFARLAKTETDHAASFDDARLIGVFE